MSVNNIINNNSVFVQDINNILHSEGIEFSKRLDLILEYINNIIYKKKIITKINEQTEKKILDIIKSVTINYNEIFQILFMFYCNKKHKINLDQYYTPYTIGEFITKLMLPNKKLIDPACGTGDLVKNYIGDITLWDICPNVLEICEQNYKLNNKKVQIECLNSLFKHDKNNNYYDYCVLNPPFGSSTIISDKKVLDNYSLGKNKKKEEVGLLFIERSINLVVENGYVFIIVPNGYLGNCTKNVIQLKNYLLSFKIIAIIELPSNSFSRSGTGVSTSILILQKITTDMNYNIYIKKIKNIGYTLNKKNTPHKYKMVDGKHITRDNKPILDNDLEDCYNELITFNYIEKLSNIKSVNNIIDYEILNVKNIENKILDINRYLNLYKNVLNNKTNNKKIKHFIIKDDDKFIKNDSKEYIYLDIKQITSPIYNKNNLLFGYDLPGRAKIKLRKYDIIVSRLKGKISFSIILDDIDNIVCTNGFCLLRPVDYKNALILFANLFTNDFVIQHNSLCTGSIMETISDTELKNININEDIDFKKYENIIKALEVINNL